MLGARPITSAGVAPLPGNGGGNNPNQQNAQFNSQSATSIVRNVLRQSTQQKIDYDPVYNNIYEDKTLQEFAAEVGQGSEGAVKYFKEHASGYMIQFLESAKQWRQGRFHNMVQDMVNNYHIINPAPQQGSFVKKEYTDMLRTRNDLYEVVVCRIAIWFGYGMMNIMRSNPNNTPNPQQALDCCRAATINILNIEFICWLNGSNKGKQFMFNPALEVQELTNKFNTLKQKAAIAFQFFDEHSPYDSITIGGTEQNKGGVAAIFPELNDFNIDQRLITHDKAGQFNSVGEFIPNPTGYTNEQDRELLAIAFDNLRARNNYVPLDQPNTPQPNPYDEYQGDQFSHRTDIYNIKPYNRNQYDLKQFFKKTSLPNWYEVKEDDWLFIKSVLKRSPKQRMEETLTKYCVRLVQYDFDHENEYEGWTSRSIRFKDVDKEMILSDPAKLLPLLTETGYEGENSLNVMDAKSFFDKEGEKLGPDAEVFEQLRQPNFDYHVVKSKESMVSENTAGIVERMQVMGHTLSADTNKPIAIFNEFTVEGAMLFESKQKRDLIYQRFPMLFTDNDVHTDHSYFSIIENITNTLGRHPVDNDQTEPNDRFDLFVERRLTQDLNNWFINACGYAVKKEDGSQLTVDNIFKDREELKKYLLVNDKDVYDVLNQTGRECLLMEQMKLFVPPVEPDPALGPFERNKVELSLKRNKTYLGIVICNQPGPKPTENKTIVLRHSNNPEFFSLLNELKKDMKEQSRGINSENIFVMYKNTNDLFLVTPVVYDENVVTIRTILPRRTLLNPMFG